MNPQTAIRIRAGGILRRENRILFQRNKRGDAWVLPGGRVEGGETTSETIVREFREELGLQVSVSRPVCMIENFNAYGNDGLHEISIYYVVTSGDEISVSDSSFKGQDPTVELTFRWIPVDGIDQHKIYPGVLKEILKSPSDEMRHFEQR